MKRIADRLVPAMPLPTRIEEGAWWLATNDWVGDGIYDGTFERPERRFFRRALRPGMVVLDIGAHHGLYSMIAARAVGPSGRVIAFEPSPRERKRLGTHRRINRFHHIDIEPLALGREPGRATLYLPPRRGSGFNSLNPAEDLRSQAEPVEVVVSTLDIYLDSHPLQVDLMKIDVEGGELDVLTGARGVLASSHRPAILCEAEDERTQPWGYDAIEIVRMLEASNYVLNQAQPGGRLLPVPGDAFPPNLVAIPRERQEQWADLMVEHP